MNSSREIHLLNGICERERIQSSEGFAQNVLTSLVVGGQLPCYNKPRSPSALGRKLLRSMWQASFGANLPENVFEFTREFCLPSQREEDPDRWPDLAASTSLRLILFELKTISGSMRESQIGEQIELARHNYPDKHVDMIYLTAEPVEDAPALDDRSSYANLLWVQVAASIHEIWTGMAGPEGDLARQLELVPEI